MEIQVKNIFPQWVSIQYDDILNRYSLLSISSFFEEEHFNRLPSQTCVGPGVEQWIYPNVQLPRRAPKSPPYAGEREGNEWVGLTAGSAPDSAVGAAPPVGVASLHESLTRQEAQAVEVSPMDLPRAPVVRRQQHAPRKYAFDPSLGSKVQRLPLPDARISCYQRLPDKDTVSF